MNSGFSIDEAIAKGEIKARAKKMKIKEKKRADRESKVSAEVGAPEADTLGKREKKAKLSRVQRTALLDGAASTTRESMPQIEEKELKEVLKIVVKILNTIPLGQEPMPKFEEDANPHRKAKGESHMRRRDRVFPGKKGPGSAHKPHGRSPREKSPRE
ncbi:uncharacterized protein NEMAJ01_0782 [Nematocida major]|uniref:uncharacterized protein n=1 Tax=Nematocida major TaxID=1912982 RepID=UPI002007B50F|nr:uncharacterized protein NEMAJ01_0782 [Nematocida major]KAH9385886.1 hypothetical protein NEMAJ01_0782 [Nematocida major]